MAHIAIRKFRLANPQGKAGQKKPRKRKPNPVQLVTLGFANPHKPSKEAKMKTRKTNGSKKTAATRGRKKNPNLLSMFGKKTTPKAAPKKKHSKHHGRRKRNPELLGKSTTLVKQGAAALVGFVAARQVPQLVLGPKNTGVVGYGLTIVTAIATHMAVAKAAGKDMADAAVIGAGMQLTSRLLNEYVSPVGKILSLSGVGDPVAAGLGDIKSGYFPLPVVTKQNTLDPILPRALQPAPMVAAPAGMPAPAATSQMAGVSNRSSRFATRH